MMLRKDNLLCKQHGEWSHTHRITGFRNVGCACKCEVCGKVHPTWNCCDLCNYDVHRCHFCGDWLEHGDTVDGGKPNPCYVAANWCSDNCGPWPAKVHLPACDWYRPPMENKDA